MGITYQAVQATETSGVGPLASLTSSSNGLATFRYPSDLASNSGVNTKNHWVTFTISDIQPVSFGSTTTQPTLLQNPGSVTAATAAVGTAYTAFAGGAAALGAALNQGSVKGAAIAAAGTAAVGAAGVTAGVALAAASLSGVAVSPQVTAAKSVISLYMPDTLNATYDANYEEMSLTNDLGSAITTLRAIDQVAGGVNIKGIGNEISGDPNTIQAVTSAMETAGVDVPGVNVPNLATVLQRAQGFALNPQLQMIYRGTGLRSFQLTFTFTPKSAAEAATVNQIIQQLRFYASPSLQTGVVSTQSMFLIPPSVFNIQFFVGGQESTVLPKYGQCVLTSMDVNHAPNGFAAYSDKSMVQTQLNLSFKETDILTRDKIDSGARR